MVQHADRIRVALAAALNAEGLDARMATAREMIARAATEGAEVVCFPEAFLPGLRGMDFDVPPPDQARQAALLTETQAIAAQYRICVVMGMEWASERGLHNGAVVIDPDGSIQGWQMKNQIPPEEASFYVPDGQRRLFTIAGVPTGIAICHEFWRYPETVRWAASRGARLLIHPQLTGSDLTGPGLSRWCDPDGPVYEKVLITRAAENTIAVVSVNNAMRFQSAASAVIGPDGDLRAMVPYGEEQVLVHDLDLGGADGFFVRRYDPALYPAD